MLLQMRVADFPTMKGHARKNLFGQIHRQAYPSFGEVKPMTTTEIGKLLSGH